ncbi:MAG: hypothetical protein AAF799_14785 [Myxococcota bacterium]
MVAHRIALGGPRLFGGADRPVLLERSDARFIANLREELADRKRHREVRSTRVRPRDSGELRLYQPMHRVFHLALVAATCDEPTRPRLDPLKVDSAGLVIRRLARGSDGQMREQAWLTTDDRSHWGPPELWDPQRREERSHPGPGLVHADPDPDRRPRWSAGRPELDALLSTMRRTGSSRRESVTPLFPLSPTEAAGANETLLFGLVNTASSETESTSSLPTPSLQELEDAGFFPRAFTETESWEPPSPGLAIDDPRAVGLDAYRAMIQTIVVTFDLEGEGQASLRLQGLLEALEVELEDGRRVTVLEHVRSAAKVLVHGNTAESFEMPHRWPAISKRTRRALLDAAWEATQARFASARAGRSRYGDRDAQYVVRTFVRVRREDGCPPDLVWSEPSAPFEIAAWFEGSPAPKRIIELPDPLNGGLAAIKPSVAFSVPSSFSNFLGGNSEEDILTGNASEGSGPGFGFLCAWSIPIVTLCAFAMLTIIVNLLNWVFWWLPFVKICIPIKTK